MKPGCIGKSNTNNLPAPTDLTGNPYGKKTFFNDATQKSASMVQWGIAIDFVPWSPIFEKCPHLREKGGVLTLKTPVRSALSHTVHRFDFECNLVVARKLIIRVPRYRRD
jgi:hypothetical protein